MKVGPAISEGIHTAVSKVKNKNNPCSDNQDFFKNSPQEGCEEITKDLTLFCNRKIFMIADESL